jgi:outer membrane protein W
MRALTILAILLTIPLRAAEIEAGIRHVATTMTADGVFEGGEIEVPDMSRGWAATGEVFWSDAFSTHAAATFINPAVFLQPSDGGETVDLDTLGINAWSVTARWNFGERWSPFIGAGGAWVRFGTLDDRFADEFELEVKDQFALVGEAGVRYRIWRRVWLDLAATYMPLRAGTRLVRSGEATPPLPEELTLDPITLSGGVAWRF